MHRAFCIAVIALTACAVAAPAARLGEPVEIRLGGSVAFGPDFSVAFTRVVSDSRCPTGVNCIQAGEAVVELTVSGDGTARGITLATPPSREAGQRAEVFGHVIELQSLEPYPTADQTTPPAYSVRIVVTAP